MKKNNKEELKKEAEEKWHNHKIMDFQGFYNHHYYYLGYVEGAESREKRIADLEKENAELKLKLDALEGQTPWKDIKDKSEVIGKLAKAKEIIYRLMDIIKHDLKCFDTIAGLEVKQRAEQFLKENE